MLQTLRRYAVLTAAGSTLLFGDFSYEQTSKITGGMMASMMKFAGAFSKQAREPIHSTIAVKGDLMVHLSPQHASVIDLGKETITGIDFQKKTYSVMTFAEMQQAMEQAAEKLKSKEGGEMNFKVSADPTGQTKNIAGFDARELVLKMVMEATDPKSGQKGNMVIVTDMWMAPKVPGYDEVTAFYRRMMAKLSWAPGGNMFMGRPDIAKGMAEVYKEMSKLEGMPVYQVIKMGAEGMPETASNPGHTPPAQNTQAQAQQEEHPSMGGALGGALGGRLGRFGGFGRKKKDEPKQQEQPAAEPQQAPSGQAQGVLMEMTTELSGFSAAPVDNSKFEVPAGFKQVESDLKRMR